MEFILASSNPHKSEELNKLFDNLTILAADSRLDVVENGSTYHENAFLKAKAYFTKYKKPTVADDSGLNVAALPDELGVHSARFAPEHEDYKDKCDVLLKKIESAHERSASFTCVLCFYLNEREHYFFEGRVLGEIAKEQKGDKGFGYDPVFIPESLKNQTLAQNPEWKMDNSHRAKAVEAASKFFAKKV
jgi:XTP/dITP diphosphohydrolase